MFVDLNDSDEDQMIASDICIAGAGPAGITLALALQREGRLSVVVLESGGLDFDQDSQDLYRGRVVGLPYYDLDATRLRYFGGSTNHWGGWCAPLDEIDFERRDWVTLSGWPFGKQQLEPYYRQAQGICQLGAYRYRANEWRAGNRFMSLLPGKLEHRIWQFSPPTYFGRRYREPLAASRQVQVVFHANVTDIVLEPGFEQVAELQVRTLSGRTARVRARAFVLACGGLEIPRLLLSSTRQLASGIGNRHDLVGRYFMEHPHVVVGSFVTCRDPVHFRAYQRPRKGDDDVLAGLGPTPQAQERLGILNASCQLRPVLPKDTGVEPDIMSRRPEKDLPARLARESPAYRQLAQALCPIIADRNEGQSETSGFMFFDLVVRAESLPLPHSRVSLTAEQDALGLRRLALDWRLADEVKRTARETARLVAEELGYLDLGRAHLESWVLHDDGWPSDLTGGNHHMGTARMSDDPTRGVVDWNCRVHGIGNLYVAGSAVFPTSGWANPTLTVVALALRLADHLTVRFAGLARPYRRSDPSPNQRRR
jgi:choline dehydrogenase-like flavoprotein